MILEQDKIQVEGMPIDWLIPYPNNAKEHPQRQIRQIARSIQQFGFINPVIIDDKREVVAGHGRLEAAKLLKLKKIPVIRVEHLTKAEIRAYRLADNQLTLNSGYDDVLLKVELQELSDLDLSFDLDITGFEPGELDVILHGGEEQEDDPADEVPEADENTPPITQEGDIWLLGKHRLICGDATHPEVYEQLMEGTQARAVITDPPYNVPIDGHVCGNGRVKHEEFAMASGEMSEAEFTDFLEKVIQQLVAHSKDGSLHYIFMDWRHFFELETASRRHFSELKNVCVWNKSNGGMGSFYRSKHELVGIYKNGRKPHINNVELGRFGRNRTNVWDYAGANGFGQAKDDLKLHPTVKPVAMLADAIQDCTKQRQLVLDPFAGSGSALMACEKTQRTARCIELSPRYCDTIIRRWQAYTGNEASHATDGETFAEKEAQHEKA